MSVQILVKRSKEILANYYGSKFRGLILYGSVARKNGGNESDIDLLVLLKNSKNYFKELRRLTELLYPLQLESDQLISAKPADHIAFEQGEIQLYRNVKRYGIIV